MFSKILRTFKKDESSELKFTTEDHKPMDAEERKRIYETGGFVRYNRVNGNLALSRAFGDFGKLLKTSILRQKFWQDSLNLNKN